MTEPFCFPTSVHPHLGTRFIGVSSTSGFSKCHFIFTDGRSGGDGAQELLGSPRGTKFTDYMVYPADSEIRHMEIYFWDWGEMGYRFRGLKLLNANRMSCLEAGVVQSTGCKVVRK